VSLWSRMGDGGGVVMVVVYVGGARCQKNTKSSITQDVTRLWASPSTTAGNLHLRYSQVLKGHGACAQKDTPF
jgi:hypothetical protein